MTTPAQLAHTYFQDWLRSYGGRIKLANKLYVSEGTVRNWEFSYATPRACHIEEIIKISKGALDFHMIMDSTHPRNRIERD